MNRKRTLINDVGSHEDMDVTLAAAAGDAGATQDLLKGRAIGDMKPQNR